MRKSIKTLTATVALAAAGATGHFTTPTVPDDPLPGLLAVGVFAEGWHWPEAEFKRLAGDHGEATGGYIKRFSRLRAELQTLQRIDPDQFNLMTLTATDSVTWAIAAWPDTTMYLSRYPTHYIEVRADSSSVADTWYGQNPRWILRANTHQEYSVYAFGGSTPLVTGRITTTFDQLFICRDYD